MWVLALRAVANCDPNQPDRDLDSVKADCGKIHSTYRVPYEKGIAVGKVSAQAWSAQQYADATADAASDMVDTVRDQATEARGVGGELPEGAAGDAEKAANEAEAAGQDATAASLDVATAIADIDAKKAAREPWKVEGSQLGDAKKAIAKAKEAGDLAHQKTQIAKQMGNKAAAAGAKAAAQAGAAATAVHAKIAPAEISAKKTAAAADLAKEKALEEAAFAESVSQKISDALNASDPQAPVVEAVIAGLDYDADNATTWGNDAGDAADDVEAAWGEVSSADTISDKISNMEEDTVTADEITAVQEKLDALAEAEKNATQITKRAEEFAANAEKAAKKAQREQLGIGFLATKKLVRRSFPAEAWAP